jgi:SpoVK/Ycf46/Vps4 family AAA+-type ATPase
VFGVATANRIDHLPPELLRRGRLDETFFVDLPDAAAREAIAEVHLLTRPQRVLGALPPLADDPLAFCEAAGAADGFSGAELEAALVEARLAAFAERRPLAAADYRKALAATVPLSRSRAEEVASLRAWAHERARQA